MKFALHESTENIFKNTSPNNCTKKTVYIAKNSFKAVQLVLRSCENEIVNDIRIDGFSNNNNLKVSFFNVAYTFFEPMESPVFTNIMPYPDGGMFPDALIAFCAPLEVHKNETCAIWVSFYADEAVQHETLPLKLIFSTDKCDYCADIELIILNTTIPPSSKSKLSISYWAWNAGRLLENDENDEIFLKYGCARYTDNWWKVINNFAKSWRQHRINEILIYPQVLLADGDNTSISPTGYYAFDWARFDELINCLYNNDCVKTISGSRLIFTKGTVTSEDEYYAYILTKDESGKIKRDLVAVNSDAAENWWKQFLPALEKHLVHKGIINEYRQQIGDEPHTETQIRQWKYVREKVKKYAPMLIIGDAFNCQNNMNIIENDIDVFVPRLDIYENNKHFYDSKKGKGLVWSYVCNFPNGNALNRNVDHPAWMGRSLIWLTALYDLSGFLHWAWNMWQVPLTASKSRGHGYIVLPNVKDFDVYSTIRHENLLEGAQDYELLIMLKEQNPELFIDIVSCVVKSATQYETDTLYLQKAYERLYTYFN